MQVTSEQLDPCKVALTITVEPQTVAAARQKAFAQVASRLAIRGFRKGKVPPHLARQYVNPVDVQQRATEQLVPGAYEEAVAQIAVEPFANPEFELVSFPDTDTEPMVFKALVPLRPQVTLGPYRGLPLERRQLTVSDSDVDEQIEQLRGRFAEYPTIEDRPAQMADILMVDLTAVVEGRDLPELAEPKATVIEVGKNIPDFDNALVGMAVGDEKTIDALYPSEFADETLRGKRATFDVVVKEIRTRVLPELDDDFASKAHRTAKTADELRGAIRESLEKSAVEMADNELEFNLVNAIVKNSTIHFPEVLLRAEMQEEANQLQQRLEAEKATFQDYLNATGKTVEQLQQEMAYGADARIRNSLVLSEVAKAEQIGVEEADLEARIAQQASEANVSVAAMRAFIEKNEQIDRLRDQALTEKILDFLKAASTITERTLTTDELKAEQEASQNAALEAISAAQAAQIAAPGDAVPDAEAAGEGGGIETPAVPKRRSRKKAESTEETADESGAGEPAAETAGDD